MLYCDWLRTHASCPTEPTYNSLRVTSEDKTVLPIAPSSENTMTNAYEAKPSIVQYR